MKRRFIIFAVIFSAFLFASCEDVVSGGPDTNEADLTEPGPDEPAVVAVIGVGLNLESLAIRPGDSAILIAAVAPVHAANKAVTWASSNANAATVDGNGRVTGVAAGSAVITVTTVDGSFTSTCAVTVDPSIVAVDRVSIDADGLVTAGGTKTLTIEKGNSANFTATVEPGAAANTAVRWTSDNKAAATVDPETGTVSAVAGGSAVIRATTVVGGKTDTCTVTVLSRVTGVSVHPAVLTLMVSQGMFLDALVAPGDATNKAVTWTSNNAAAATVDGDGRVIGVAEGNATITVTTEDGNYQATCAVTVQPWVGGGGDIPGGGHIPIISITLDHEYLVLEKGESATLTVTVTPPNATEQISYAIAGPGASWESGEVAIDQNGTGTITVPSVTEGDMVIRVGGWTGWLASCWAYVFDTTPTPISSTAEWEAAMDTISDAQVYNYFNASTDKPVVIPRVFVLGYNAEYQCGGNIQ